MKFFTTLTVLSLLLLSCSAQDDSTSTTTNTDPAITDMTQDEADVYAKYKVQEQLLKVEELQDEIQAFQDFLVPLLGWYGDDFEDGRFSEPRQGIADYYDEVTALKNELNDNFGIHPQAMAIIVTKGMIRDKQDEIKRLQEEIAQAGTTQSDDSADTTTTSS